MTETHYFSARTDRDACSIIAAIRKPGECFATFRSSEPRIEGEEDTNRYRAVPLDIDHVDALTEERRPGTEDPVETYAATFGAPGEFLIGVN